MPAKLERCVRKVKAQQRKKGAKKVKSPYAVCIAATGQKPHKRKSTKKSKKKGY